MVVLFQILSRILQQQQTDGSWGKLGSREETSYAIIALTYLASLHFVLPIEHQIYDAVQRGRRYLVSTGALAEGNLTKKEFIWIAKVSYASENVRRSYILAALNSPLPYCSLDSRVKTLVHIPLDNVEKSVKFHKTLSLFKSVDDWLIKAWLIEGYLFASQLEVTHMDVFGSKGTELERYLMYIPFSWTAANGLAGIGLGAQSLFELMTFTMFIFRVDEFFEQDLASERDISRLKMLPRIIRNVFSKVTLLDNIFEISDEPKTLKKHDQAIYRQLAKYARYVFTIPKIQNASNNDKMQLKLELEAYLLANAQQLEDHFLLKNQANRKVLATQQSPYVKWVHNTGSEHFGGYATFALIVCLVGKGEDFIHDSQVKYIAQDCSRRLSVALRMFNDSRGLARDRKEVNLNSVFFPEFAGENKSDDVLSKELISIAKYEKKCLAVSFRELEMVCGTRFRQVYDTVNVFYNLCEYYTDLYEMKKDILLSKK